MLKRGSERDGGRERTGEEWVGVKNGPPSAQDISENIMKALHCSLSIHLHKQ